MNESSFQLKLLPNGRTECYLSEDSELFHTTISYIYASAESLFVISEDGRLFARGKTNFGQCGVIQTEEIEQFREIKLVAPLAICPHGITVTSNEAICVRQVAASERQVCVMDDEGHLWSYGDRSLKIDSNGCIEARMLPLSQSRRVVQLEAGRSHFVCLVAYCVDDTERATEFASDAQFVRSHILPSEHCARCREENECRLSTLMQRADDDAEESHELEEMVRHDDETSEKLMTAARNFRLLLQGDSSPSSSSSPRARTLPLQSEPSYFRSSFSRRAHLTSNNQSTADGAIEMSTIGPSTIGLDLMNLPGGRFTFVSLDNLPLTYMDSDENESSSNTSNTDQTNTTIASNSSHRSATSTPRKTATNASSTHRDERRFPLEVWTWGENNVGQLGHNDQIARREPFKIAALSGICCIKISSGDYHSVALTGTGELYVWGSNKCGQLKQSDQPYITIPTLFKVGSQSSVLDVSASVSQTALIVSGIDATPTVYFCGHNTYSDFTPMNTPQTFRISSVEKIGFPMCVRLLGVDLMLGICERHQNIDSSSN
ncbi:unnamed protein product, partial [Anisakis simplex]|uniref:Alsin n=1 Tax=Anisakis simplex TaxID=6269 RepID=A0A0M3KBG3_ANISI